MNRILYYFLFIFSLFSCTQIEIDWPESTQTAKPWTRWWWMNNGVDKQNLTRELQEFAQMGIGGVEITPIYGVKGEEHRTIDFLSPQFSEMIKFTIDEATRLGMGVDMPAGSGWRNGGPFVPRENGLWNLKIEKRNLKYGETLNLTREFEGVACASFLGEKVMPEILDPEKSFTARTNGTVFAAIRVKSNDKVKRPAKGGEGWAIDTFNEDITIWYLKEFWKRLGIEDGKIRCFFHDSFEYTGDFTTNFLNEFKNRRGYNLENYLHALDSDCKDVELVARVKSDYRQTLSDLVLESFIQPMTEWANGHQSLNRNQAHGSPGNILDLYAACDIPETEIFQRLNQGSPDIFVNKFASSAAHINGQKLVSSESYTWLDEHWTVTPSELVKATNRFFLAGVNHIFFHGTCYSPDDAQWPGWLFYASTQLNNRNPIWREMPALFKYIDRTQSVLQEAKPQADLLIYWPYFDVAASEGKIFNHLGVNKDAGWFTSHPISKLSEKLMAAGYPFDYISDKQLQNIKLETGKIVTEGNSFYKAIVVPQTGYIPVETMKKLVEISKEKVLVIFEESLPESVPGMFELEKRVQILSKLKNEINTNRIGETIEILNQNEVNGERDLSSKGFYFLKMNWQNEACYLVFNMGEKTKDEWISLNEGSKNFVLMNPMTGKISSPETKNNSLRIQLQPEEIVFVRCSKKKTKAPVHQYFKEESPVLINGLWKVEFLEGGPVYPGNIDMVQLQSWTKAGDEETKRFAGTARYKIDFDWDGVSGGYINLGEVRDCAHVYVNGKDYGTLLGPSFMVYIDNLQKGSNLLQVEVTNIAANRIRDLDIRGIEWRRFYDINFVNIDYLPFNASEWEIRDAGLMEPVTISPR